MLTSSVESTPLMPFDRAGIAMGVPTGLSAPSVLCVGNDPTLLHTRQLLLGKNGYRVSACPAKDLFGLRLPKGLDAVLICHSVKGKQLEQVLAWSEERFPRDKILLTEAMFPSQQSWKGYGTVASERPERLLEFLRQIIMPPA